MHLASHNEYSLPTFRPVGFAYGALPVESMKNLRPDARVLVTSFGALLALQPDPHQCSGEDCDCREDGYEPDTEAVYNALDWRDGCAPSFAFDQGGDLRAHDGARCYGPVIQFVEGTADDLADWPETMMIFR